MGRKCLCVFLGALAVLFLNVGPTHAQSLSPSDERVEGEILIRYTELGAQVVEEAQTGGTSSSPSFSDLWGALRRWLGWGNGPEDDPENVRAAREKIAALSSQFGVTGYLSLARKQPAAKTIKLGARQVFTNPSDRVDADPLADVYLVSFEQGTIEDFVAAAESSGIAEEAQPNFRYQAEAVPNDTDYATQWYHQRIHTEQAWDTTTGSDQIITAVLDTGVMYTHPDLAANMWQGDTGQGTTGYGYDFISNDDDPNDENGHGTHVAGIIGAVGNNSVGIAGVNWRARIMAVRVLNRNGGGTTAGVSQGIRFAADNGARVLNVSLGQVSQCDKPDTIIGTAIDYATSRRALMVVAAGNSHINAACDSPANHPDVLVVSARGPQDEWASYTNYGLLTWKQTKIVSAPGGVAASGNTCSNASCILSTRQGGGYGTGKGTSFAAPVVTGLAGLILSARDMDPAALRSHILASSDDKGDDFTAAVNPNIPNDDGRRTYGKLINAAAAFANLTGPTSTPPAPTVTAGITPSAVNCPSVAPAPGNTIPVGCTDELTVNIGGQTTPSPTPPAGTTASPTPPGATTPTTTPTQPSPTGQPQVTITPGGSTPTPGGSPSVTPGGPTQPPGGGGGDDDGDGDNDDGDGDNDDGNSGGGGDDGDDDKDDQEVDAQILVRRRGRTEKLANGASVNPNNFVAICYNRAAGPLQITIDTGKGSPALFRETYRNPARNRCLHVHGDRFIRVGEVGNNLSSRMIRITINSGGKTVTKRIRVVR